MALGFTHYNDTDYTVESAVYDCVLWGARNNDWDVGIMCAQEGLVRMCIDKDREEYVLTADHIREGRMHSLWCTRKLPYTRLGATRRVKRWMREIYRNDLVDK